MNDDARFKRTDEHIRRRYTALKTITLIKAGEIVFSRGYGSGSSPDALHPMMSVTKSVISSLIGIAIAHGHIRDTNQTINELLVDRISDPMPNPEIGELSLHQLLSMTTGIIWRDGRLGNEPFVQRMMQHPNWTDFFFTLPIDRRQVGSFQYNSAISHLLSVIVTATTGSTAEEFARNTLFAALKIKDYRWERDPQRHSVGGWGLELSARDMVKYGLLYLNRGVFDDRQVIPEKWVEASRQAHTPGYGYQWWLKQLCGCSVFCAQGLGGQIICCIPELDALIVTTSGRAGRRRSLWPLFEEYVVPALKQH